MNHQQNLNLGLRLRDKGLDLVEEHNLPWIDRIRNVAVSFSFLYGHVSADDLREYAVKNNVHPAHPNAWGAVFRGKGWKVIARKKSTTPSAHAREIKVWRYLGVNQL